MKKGTRNLLAAITAAATVFPAGLTDILALGPTAYAVEDYVIIQDGGSSHIDYDYFTTSLVSEYNSTVYTDSIYDQLPEQRQALYNKMYNLMKDRDAENSQYNIGELLTVQDVELTSSGYLTESSRKEIMNIACQEIYTSFYAMVYDHPELAWIDGRGISFTFKYSITPAEKKCVIKDVVITLDSSVVSGVTKEDMDLLVKNAASKIISKRKSSGKYDTLLAIHDYLCETIQYNDKAASTGYDTSEATYAYQTSYSAFARCNGDENISTVCAGYAKGFKVLCDYFGINCAVIRGMSYSSASDNVGGAHAWNNVEMNNKWYGVDCTWDDQTAPKQVDKIFYDFFMVGADTVPTSFAKISFSRSHVGSGVLNNAVEFVQAYPELESEAYDYVEDISIDAPVITSAEVSDSGNVKLSWGAVSGATSYYVYRADSADGKKTLVGNVSDTTILDNTTKRGKTYYYYVTAYNGDENVSSNYSEVKTVKIEALGTPVISSIEAEGTSVTLSWNKINGATSYRVYRADTLTGEKTLLKACQTTSYIDNTVSAGKTYYYFVAAYDSGAKEISGYSEAKSVAVKAALAAPSITSINTDGKSVTLAWNTVDGATSYRVYRADSATGAKTQLKVRTSPNFTDTTVTAGKTYYYFVAAYDANNSVLSAYSAGKSIAVKAALAAPSITSISSNGKSVTLAWNTVDGATSYRVYRADSATGAKTQLKVRTSPNYTDTTVTAGKTYYYFVAAYDANNSVLSAYSAGKSVAVKAALAAPSITSISSNGKSVTLAWNTVDGATSYRVYRADSATGAKTQLKVRTSPNFTDTTVTAGKTYYYFVAAYDANNSVLSAYSAGKSIAVKAALAAPSITSISSNGKSVMLAWNTVDGATSYRVYRADSATGAKTQLKVRTSPNYTDTTVTAGKTYYYFVAAYDANNSVLSAYSAGKSVAVKAALAAPSITSIETDGKSVMLAWNTVDGATSYRVYRADSATGAKSMLKVRTSPNFTDTTVTAGKTYYYFVAAYDANNSVLSAYSVAKNIVVE